MAVDPYEALGGQRPTFDPLAPFGAIGSWLGLGGGATPPPPEPTPPPAPPAAAAEPEEPDPYDQLIAARAREANANAAAAEAQAELRRQELLQAQSPEGRAKAQAELATANAQLATAQLQLQRLLTQLSPEAQARLENDLALDRERIRQDFEERQQNARLQQERTLQTERLGFEREEGLANRRARAAESMLSAGVQLRDQELARLRAQDDFVLRSIANRLQQGQINVSRANQLMDAYLRRAQLPIEIFQARAAAAAPYIPYLTSRKAGEAFPGFEAGGPMESLYRQAGLEYNPKLFEARPVTVELDKLYGNPAAGLKGLPDPGKVFPPPLNEPMPTSAVAGAQLPSVAPLVQNLMPSFGGATAEDQARMQQFIQSLGG